MNLSICHRCTDLVQWKSNALINAYHSVTMQTLGQAGASTPSSLYIDLPLVVPKDVNGIPYKECQCIHSVTIQTCN